MWNVHTHIQRPTHARTHARTYQQQSIGLKQARDEKKLGQPISCAHNICVRRRQPNDFDQKFDTQAIGRRLQRQNTKKQQEYNCHERTSNDSH